MNWWTGVPLLRLVPPVIGGIVAAYYLNPVEGSIYIGGVVFCLILLPLCRNKRAATAGPAILLIYFCLFFLYTAFLLKSTMLKDEVKGVFLAEIISGADPNEKTTGYDVGILYPDNLPDARIYLQRKPGVVPYFLPGDQLIFRSKGQKVPPPVNPWEFDYGKFLRLNHIGWTFYIREDQWKKIKGGATVTGWSIARREAFIKNLAEAGLAGNELTVAAALLTGFKAELNPELIKAYSASGAMHVLAVSGLHLGVIFLLLRFITARLLPSKRKWLRFIIVIAGIWLYALFTGSSASVLRAATMFSAIAFSNIINRKTKIYNTLGCAAILLLVADPLLVFSVGFQLSFLAVLGIVSFQPVLKSIYQPSHTISKWLWDISVVSFAAQLMTFPASVYYFHQFPNYFLLSNFLVIPLSVIIIYTGCAFAFVGWFSPLREWIGWLLKYEVQFLNEVVTFFHHLPGSVTDGIQISLPEVILLYATIGLFLLFFYSRKTVMLKLSAVSLILSLSLNAWNYSYARLRKELLVLGIKKHTVIIHRTGTKAIVYCDSVLIKNPALRYHLDGYVIQEFLDKPDLLAIRSGDRISLDNLDLSINNNTDSNTVLVASGKTHPQAQQKKPRIVLLDGSVGWKAKRNWIRWCEKNNVKYIDIMQEGAVRLTL